MNTRLAGLAADIITHMTAKSSNKGEYMIDLIEYDQKKIHRSVHNRREMSCSDSETRTPRESHGNALIIVALACPLSCHLS